MVHGIYSQTREGHVRKEDSFLNSFSLDQVVYGSWNLYMTQVIADKF